MPETSLIMPMAVKVQKTAARKMTRFLREMLRQGLVVLVGSEDIRAWISIHPQCRGYGRGMRVSVPEVRDKGTKGQRDKGKEGQGCIDKRQNYICPSHTWLACEGWAVGYVYWTMAGLTKLAGRKGGSEP